jgi:hypothetical protein
MKEKRNLRSLESETLTTENVTFLMSFDREKGLELT